MKNDELLLHISDNNIKVIVFFDAVSNETHRAQMLT